MRRACKNCKLHRLDTLADGTKENYCYPPLSVMCFAIPCKDRRGKNCKALRKLVKNCEKV